MTFFEAINCLINGASTTRRPCWHYDDEIWITQEGCIIFGIINLCKEDIESDDWEVI